jgi:hypothetical protein
MALGSALVLLSAVGAVVHEAPGAFRDRVRAGGAYHDLGHRDRLFLALRAYDIDTDVYVLALDHIPLGATYALLTGPDTRVSSGIVLPKVDALAPYAFLPRRRVPVEHAQWVISYGVKPDAIGAPVGPLYDTGNGRWVAQVRR